jgi:hypothetical protein
MRFAPHPVKVATAVLAALFLTAVVWVLRGYVWPGLSSVEVATLQARLDPALFTRDFVVQESLRFTPRFYFNALIVLVARSGLPLAWAFAALHLVALAILLSGLRALARALSLGAVATAALLLWLLTVGVGTVGLTYLYTHAPVPAVWAVAGVAWGAAWAVRARWTAAYACFGAAALLQFLVGFYAGVLALPALLLTGGRARAPALALWLLGLTLIYGPMRLDGGTGDSDALSGAAFVEIYATLRHPHHLVPSTWGWPVWIQAGSFYLGAWYFLRRTAGAEWKTERTVLHLTLALTLAALALNYVFIELRPLAWIAKLQPARITPLAQGIILALLARRVQARVAAGDYAAAALLVLIPFTAVPGFLLLLAAVLLSAAPARFSARHAALAVAVLLAFQPFDPSLAARAVRYALWAALFGAMLAADGLTRRPRLLAATALATVFAAGLAARASLDPRWPPFLAQRFAPDAPPADAPGLLGRRFAANSPKDALVLAPPGAEAWTFKLHGRRALVVDDKNFPFTERGIRTWRERMERVLGTPLTPGLDLNAAWAARSPAALAAVAADYGARYILTRDDWHLVLPGLRLDREQGWSLWQVP